MVIHDLMPGREYTTHFLSLGRAGETHPDAISPVTRALPPELQGAFWLSVQSPQICGQHAAWLLSGTGPCGCHVEVWDWKAGKLVWTRTFPNDVIFTFLDPFHIALVGKAFSGPRSLVIYRVASADVDPVCSLGLPPLVSPGSSLIFCDKIICNTRPAGTWPTSTAPFQHDPAAALVIIHFGDGGNAFSTQGRKARERTMEPLGPAW
ncbi:hypothetical protein C8Q70DRAFT_244946 [Cubamyces menziesii]|nr:hypothetical protein C8Q70DRAFT_244946 [Cubamyces menziesii]